MNYPTDKIEIIVVNDPQDVNSEKVVKLFRKNHAEINIVIIPSINNASHAWNLGIQHSHGEIVGVSPDDAIFNPDSVRRAIALMHSNSKIAAVTFTCIFEDQSLMYEVHHMRFIGSLTSSVSTVFLVTFYRKRLIENVGLYREDLGPPTSIHEDWELGSRIRKRGYILMLDGATLQTHLGRNEKKPLNVKAEKSFSIRFKNKIRKWLFCYPKYVQSNYKTFFVVMKSSPLTQQIEYTSYFFAPLIGLSLLFLNVFYFLVYIPFLLLVIAVYSNVRGYYRVFGHKKRLTYPILLVAVRVVRTYLSIVGLLRGIIVKAFRSKDAYTVQKQNIAASDSVTG